MTTYLVTGGTGFLGRHLVELLLRRPDAQVHVLVRAASASRLARLAAGWEGGDRVVPLVGDLSADGLGLSADAVRRLTGKVDHLVHLAALYDMSADEARNEEVNVGGTERVVALANTLRVSHLHHVSSVAVAGEHRGEFTEEMFDEGQTLPSPYHRTKFLAERIVREESAVPWRVYRPAIVLGHSRTGEMDKVDGPYYFFPLMASVAQLPGGAALSSLPLVGPDLGDTNVVSVDYVAAAMDVLIHRDGLDGRAFHLVSPRPQRLVDVYNAFAGAAGAPRVSVTLPVPSVLSGPLSAGLGLLGRLPGTATARDLVLTRLGIPPEVLPHSTFPSVFTSDATRAELAGSGVEVAELTSYAPVLWAWWAAHLDPVRARRRRDGGPLAGRTVVVTGASSGIGKATALLIARRGGTPLLLARRTEELEKVRAEIEAEGGSAGVYSVDLTSAESVDACVKQMLADHEGIDMLVNNAGRSIRRSVKLSYERIHDVERTIALNYLGPVRLVLALLPHMTERRFGHVVNVSSIGVQAHPPRFSAYVGSKAALDNWSQVVASELVGDGVTFTNVHMPLVRTPMISPTKIYDRFPTLTPDQAAGMLVRALEERPKHVGTRLGTTAVIASALAPKVVDAVLHTAYHVFPDSAAAGGTDAPRVSTSDALSRGAAVMMRLLPGVHW